MSTLLEDAPVLTATSVYPELCVEWLPTQGPGAADGDWCDITAYVAEGSCSRGRQYELERFVAGSCELVLKADSRLFDQDWAAGPFYPWLVPMRQLRISAVWNSTRYAVWRGFITDWGQVALDGDNLLVTTIQARDAFAFMEVQTLPSSWYEAVVAQDQPTHWWRLDEQTGTRAVDSGYGTTLYDGTYTGSPTLDDAALVTYDGDRNGVTFATGTYMVAPLADTYSGAFTASFWFDTTDPASVPYTTNKLLVLHNGAYTAGVSIYFEDVATKLVVVMHADATRIEYSSYEFNDGSPHLLTVTHTGGAAGTLSLYVDGTLLTSDTSNAVGAVTRMEVVGSEGTTNAIGEIAIWPSALSATRILAHYNAGATAFTGEATGTRIGRVLDLKAWPSTLRDLDTGASTVGAYELAGQSLAEYVQQMADTEAGQTYIDADGKIVHRSRHNLWLETRSKTSQATFGDAHSAATLHYIADGFSLARDEALIRNPVTATRSGGISATVSDADKIEKYGERTWSMPVTYDSTDTVLRSRAAYYLTSHKELGTRLESMTVKPVANPSGMWPQVLGRQIGDRITVKRTTLGTGTETSAEQILEGVAHRFSPTEWTTTFRGSPADLTIYAIWDDATYGVWDSGKWAY